MKQLIKHSPIPLAGLALGIIALGTLLKPLSEGIYWGSVCAASLLIVMLIARVALFPHEVRDDLRNSVFASVSGTFFMTVMQISVGVSDFAPSAAFVLWSDAIFGHFALIAWFTLTFVRHFKWDDVVPTYFIAYIGIIVISVTSPTFGMQAFGQGVFWFGFVLYAALLVVVSYRIATRPLPDGAKPLICIYAAPMSLSLTGYLAVYDQPNIVFAIVLAILAQLLLAGVLTQLPRLFRLLHGRFFPSIAAMTFPFVISATALGRLCTAMGAAGIGYPVALDMLVDAETVLASAMVVYAMVRYGFFFARKVQEEALAKSDIATGKASA